MAGCGSSGDDENERDPDPDAPLDPEQAAAIKSELVEMLDALNGTASWQFEDGGDTYEILLELTQQKKPAATASARGVSPFLATAHACGTQTFYQSASACITTYQLAVEGTLTLRRLGATPETIVSDLALDGAVQNFGGAQLTFRDDGYLMLLHMQNGSFAIERFMASGLGDEKLSLEFVRSER